MMVTFISQCEKKALNRTRRVLDSFADRIGNNTWQSVITQDGLNAVKKLLRKTASKNTAVSCHWIRSRSRSEVVWVVGNHKKFNLHGQVPVNTTRRNLLYGEWENTWIQAETIQIVAVLAALLHDMGKATLGFQKKLTVNNSKEGDTYRHEWISLRLFEAMVTGCKDDNSWLTRLANFDVYSADNPNWLDQMVNDTTTPCNGFDHLPPIAQLVAWLIVTHHRLPFYDQPYFKNGTRKKLKTHSFLLKPNMEQFYKNLKPVNGWVKNQKACDSRTDANEFWQFEILASTSKSWQKAIKRWANKALNHSPLMAMQQNTIANPLVMHLARLCLMVGDHNYSSLSIDDKKRVDGDKALKTTLIANTDRDTKAPKQALDEHLLGVAKFTSRFAKLLPQFSRELPTIINHSRFSKRTPIERFQWQNKAYDSIKKIQKEAHQNGFFGVNMASTGRGKTLGNARIMAALADPDKGVRFTIALGLRVLTLQTGLALREKLELDETSLAILVGGAANRRLFELNQEQENNVSSENIESITGSESAEALVKDIVNYERCAIDANELGTVVADPKARDLLFAPVVSCTVDHIISATETARGGRHIAPLLRLLSSDLVLDEPDDFDQADLPALSRLVHMAGMMGSKVLLSSATMTPDLISGLFIAYQSGRKIWRNNTHGSADIVCAWIDEFKHVVTTCSTKENYKILHDNVVKKRVKELKAQQPQRIGAILPLDLPPANEGEKLNNNALAHILISAACQLHKEHAVMCEKSKKTASIGLIRMANIRPMVDVARAIYNSSVTPENTQIHLCCYHARQLLLLRHNLESQLDRILNRSTTNTIFNHPEISSVVHGSCKQHHLFIVLATPVAEVGRDHDYDWAIVEPSSMRSIIQLAGRIWRHRPGKKTNSHNILILDNNIKALEAGSNLGIDHAVFMRPGFEDERHLLTSHSISTLIDSNQLANIDSTARIQKPKELQANCKLADLEHAVMADLLNNENINYVNAYWQENNASQANVHLQRTSPFRLQERKQMDYICFPDDESDNGFRFRFSEQAWKDKQGGDSVNSVIQYEPFIAPDTPVKPWLVADVLTALEKLALKLDDDNLSTVALKYATVTLDENNSGWYFHPMIGFWEK